MNPKLTEPDQIDRWMTEQLEEDVPPEVAERFRRRQETFFQEIRRESSRKRSARPVFRLHHRLRWAFSAAAAILLLVGVTTFLTNRPRSLYARVIKTLENTRTIHAVLNVPRDGDWITAAEIWYERGKGVVEQETRRDVTRIRLDNGVYQWVYSSDTNTARKTESRDPIGVVKELFDPQEFERAFLAPAEGVKTVDGIECRVYSHTNPDRTWKMEVWLDENEMLVRGWKKQRLNDKGEWEDYKSTRVEYDVPIDPSRFSPHFGADVTVVEAGKLLLENLNAADYTLDKYALEKAISVREVLGLNFAVHEVVRCEGDIVYTVCSIRPTEESLTRINGDRSSAVGDFTFLASREQPEDGEPRWYAPCTFAYLQHGDLYIQWSILILKGSWPEKIEECDLDAYIHTRGLLEQSLAAEGEKTYKRVRSLSVLALPEGSTPLAEVISKVHTETLALGQTADEVRLCRASKPVPGKEGSRSRLLMKPSELSRPEFEADCFAEIECLKSELPHEKEY